MSSGPSLRLSPAALATSLRRVPAADDWPLLPVPEPLAGGRRLEAAELLPLPGVVLERPLPELPRMDDRFTGWRGVAAAAATPPRSR